MQETDQLKGNFPLQPRLRQDSGQGLMVSTLDHIVGEKALYDTFGQFGPLINAPKVARDETNMSKGYGFISYGDFESSDAAIASMHGQYMMNKQISGVHGRYFAASTTSAPRTTLL